jgi:quinol monooxygenase YgiN
MSEIVVVGSFTIEPGKEEEAVEAMQALVEPTHAEDGCILYALHRGVDDPRRLAFVERWASREQLDAHLQSEHVQAILQRAPELFGQSGDIVVYEALPGGEPRKGSLAAHAGG